MKKIIFFSIAIIFVNTCFGQGYNDSKTSLSNFIKRIYNTTPFEGVKVIDDYDHQYFISLVSLEKAKYTSPSIMNRVAQVKAQSQANTFFNGSTISSDLIIKTTEQKSKDTTNTIVETIETIKENASGFTQGLELLTNFDNVDGTRMVFIYFREIQNKNQKH
ncbi:MAG: hypothetical protein ACOYMA_14630 [Bacteroidia bacterium]